MTRLINGPFSSFRCPGCVCAHHLPVFLHFFMELGDSVCPSVHPCAAGQGTCSVIHLLGLLPLDAPRQGHSCKWNSTGFLCLHYLDKYFSLHLNYVDQAYLAISPSHPQRTKLNLLSSEVLCVPNTMTSREMKENTDAMLAGIPTRRMEDSDYNYCQFSTEKMGVLSTKYRTKYLVVSTKILSTLNRKVGVLSIVLRYCQFSMDKIRVSETH